MSDRNTAALGEVYAAFVELAASHALSGRPAPSFEEAATWFGRFAASRGALVPAALTDEQCMEVHQAGNGAFRFAPDRQRTALTRIAKGEP